MAEGARVGPASRCQRDRVGRAAGERPLGARRRRLVAGNRAWRFIAARSSNR